MSLFEISRGIQPKNRLTHVEFAKELADFLETPYYEVALGSRWGGAKRQADVVDIRNFSYENFELAILECKVNRSDFQGEVCKKKYKDSLAFCTHFYFATESDVCFREEIPRECGWIVRCDSKWSWRKKAEKRNIQIPYDFMQALLFKKKGLMYVSNGNKPRQDSGKNRIIETNQIASENW
jgi:hypothetical protein